MDLKLARSIIKDETLTDDDLSVLFARAQRMALNHYFWKINDVPTLEQKERFLEKYEFEIYGIAKAINADDARNGLVSHSELGTSMTWGETGRETVMKAVSAIPRKAYAM